MRHCVCYLHVFFLIVLFRLLENQTVIIFNSHFFHSMFLYYEKTLGSYKDLWLRLNCAQVSEQNKILFYEWYKIKNKLRKEIYIVKYRIIQQRMTFPWLLTGLLRDLELVGFLGKWPQILPNFKISKSL